MVSAKTRIDVIVDSVRRREPFTHFLSLPVTSPSVREKFLEFQEEVLRSCDGVCCLLFPDQKIEGGQTYFFWSLFQFNTFDILHIAKRIYIKYRLKDHKPVF